MPIVVMRHGLLIWSVGAVGTLVGLGLVVASNLRPNDTSTIFTTAGFMCFAGLGLYLIASARRERHELHPDGLIVGRVFGRRVQVRWDEVVELRIRRGQWVRISTSSGHHVRVSLLMRGVPEFAKAVLDHIPLAAFYDGVTRDDLKALAAGHSPFSVASGELDGRP